MQSVSLIAALARPLVLAPMAGGPSSPALVAAASEAGAARGSAEFLSLWCGTGGGELWTGSAKDMIESLFAEA